ncbi:uncharacterized protein LOC121382387 [Gigantopelta aegis]|uniref:uncharacterized protein LOC121382387 n=1 Tax=Gigantopelta aegis TaxID=1735272 RepID=UPI001B88DBB0|nr:uncharacterized protein LOC121382387 [Gigantopelta aegis]
MEGVETPSVHMNSTFSREGSTYGFCVRTADETRQNTKKTWPRGNYCILRGGDECPEDFESGSLKFYGQAPENAKFTSGPLPDGKFGRNPLFQFCCKNTGYLEDEMVLPNSTPFILLFYRNQYKTCQRIRGMYGTKEEFFVKTLPRGKNVQTFHGIHPQARQWYKSVVYIPICYYRPYNSDCGGVLKLTKDEPMMILVSPNFPKDYDSDLRCHWLIKSPANTTIVLNFDNFELEEVNGRCRDSLEIGHVRIGQPGAMYCGDGFERSIHSVFNMIKLTLRTDMEEQKQGFKALFKVIFPSEMCYNVRDHGTTYRGKVNFTRGMEPCLPWTDVTMCKHHAFRTKDVFSGLDYNYCRNPGNGLRPWCYIRKTDCVRDYCDVCLTERLFDKVDNCVELKQSGYCTRGLHVMSRCALTCTMYLPPIEHPVVYTEIKCHRPDHAKDGTVVSDNTKASYNVGEVVKLKCVSSGRTTLARCLTDGRWSVGTYVCGACAVGWSFYAGNCYRYFNQRLHHSGATKKCQARGGTIAFTRTAREEAFVLDLKEEGKTIWLAATDVELEGYWVWPDNTKVLYSNWKKGQPNNFGNEDCAIITPTNKWNDVRCFWYEKHRFVCQTRLGDPAACKDRRHTCQQLLQKRPTFCFDFQNFARHECQFTCGLCNTEGDKKCSVPRPTTNVTFVEKMTKGEGFTRGDTFTHTCIDGYQRVSGDATRACVFCGFFTGSPLVCVDIDETIGPNSDVELMLRRRVGKRHHYYTGDTDELRVDRNGQIVRWEFVTRAGGVLAFQVWRPVEDLGENHYELVGENVFRNIPDGLEVRSLHVLRDERIQVKNGDLIGVYYDRGRAHLTYDVCSDETVHVFTIDHFQKQRYKAQDVAKFSEDIGCAVFSMRAVIAPSPEL